MLRWVADADEFCSDPRGCVVRIGPFVVWCYDGALSGITLPPSADADQIRALFTVMRRSPLPGMIVPYDVVVDERQLTSLTSVGTGLFLGFLESLGGAHRTMTRNVIIVAPRDPMLAMVASGFGVMSGLMSRYRVVADLVSAFRALGRNADAHALALDDALRSVEAPELAEIERWIVAHLATARLDELARTLGKSERSLQRLFGQAGTSFGELLDRHRQARAEVQLRAGDKMEVIARELGFSSLSAFSTFFRRRTGMSPSEFRRRL